jgi:predicted Zn-ribbon and HTH transcriptional regulator
MRCISKQDTIALLLHTELQRNSKTNVLSDMPSDSKKYKDLRSEKHTYKLAIVSKRIEKSLYLIPADCKSAGTIALLLNTQHTGGYICS